MAVSLTRQAIGLHLRTQWRGAEKRLAHVTLEPRPHQEQALKSILGANAETRYGRDHGFARIRSISDFQSAIPINTYEDLRPYVDQVVHGSDPHALTSEDVEMFTSTSGTTSRPKLIPVTASGRRAERRVKDIWMAKLLHDHPAALSGKVFYLFNKAEEYRTPGGAWVGSNGGLMYRNTSAFVRRVQAVPYEVCLVDHYESRYYVILRHLLAIDLSLLVTINPSSALLLAELVNENAELLIRDIYEGTLRDGLELTNRQYEFFRERFRPDRDRARRLAKILSEDGRLTPPRYWPQLKAICSWKGPGVGSFLDGCRAWYGEIAMRDVGYGSSEFRTGLVLSDDASKNLVLPDNYFNEFIPEREQAAYLDGSRKPLLLDEVELGQRYVIVQTGPHGLYRYNIDDIVEVNGFQGRVPTLHFVQKAKLVTSLVGEKLYETHVIEAMDRVAARRPDLKPAYYLLYCDQETVNYKLCVEFVRPVSPEQLREVLDLFEAAIGEVNIEYPYKRASLRIRPPEIFQLKPGSFLKLVKFIGKNSVMDNQAKTPRLSKEVDKHFAVLGLERRSAHAALAV
jgi:hypothetical protein